ncbi:MAG: hypothetical protein HW416_1879 [Chloroflexi bacterium]|nr:hypothetical protein [Chloroflexota bacterium]
MANRVPLIAGIGLMALALLSSIALLATSRSTSVPIATPIDTPEGLASQLGPNQVAVAVRVESVAGLGGVLRRGDRVDLYALMPAQTEGGKVDTRLLLSDVPVYGVAREGELQALTLAIPDDRALLAQEAIQSGAKPFVVLRPSQGASSDANMTAFGDQDLPDWLRRVPSGRRP